MKLNLIYKIKRYQKQNDLKSILRIVINIENDGIIINVEVIIRCWFCSYQFKQLKVQIIILFNFINIFQIDDKK